MSDWNTLLSHAPKNCIAAIVENDPSMEYSGVYNLISLSQTRFSSMLGFADASLFTTSMLVDPQMLPKDCSLIVGFSSKEEYNAHPDLILALKKLKNCACMTDKARFQDLYFSLEHVFSTRAFMNNVCNSLSRMIVQNVPLQEIADTVSDAFEAPVNISSSAHTILASSSTRRRNSPTEQSEIENRSVPSSAIYALKDSGILKEIQSTRQPVHYELLGESCYAMGLYYRNKRVGYMSLFDSDRTIDEEKILYLENVGDIVALALTKEQEEKKNVSSEFNHLFELLEDRERNADYDMIRLRFSMLNYDLRENLYLLYVMPDHSQAPSVSGARLLISQLLYLLHNSCYATDADNICFLISRNDDELLTDESQKSVSDLLYDMHYKGGLSSVFRGFEEYLLYHQAAEEAIRIGTKLNPDLSLYRFDDYRIAYAAECLGKEKEHSEFFLYPPLMRLIREDQEKGTDLTYTLYCYLSTPKETDAVCEKLAVHKNTLFFRMKKIRQIMGVDLYDGPEVTKVFLTFELLRQNGRLPFDEKLL